MTVSEDSLSRAVLSIAERAKQVVEPAGAAGVAAMQDDPTGFETPAVVVLSGGNIDPLLLGKVIRQGMAAAGRYLGLRVHIPDLPGGLATMLMELADVGANVIEVVHERISPTLHLNEVEVLVQLETRGPEHSERRLRERATRCRRPFRWLGACSARDQALGQSVKKGLASTISTFIVLPVGAV